MTAITQPRRSILDALLMEPLDLIKSQPPQILISMASASLIAAEAAVLLDYPMNWALAVGAEWGYLRGMASAASVDTPWKKRLILANGALVVLYGALYSLRGFGTLPAVGQARLETDGIQAWVLTFIHIACIGAVTICAMMAHADMVSEQERQRKKREEDEAERLRKLQDERDLIRLDLERKEQDLVLWERGMEAKARIASMRKHHAGSPSRIHARRERKNTGQQDGASADAETCPKCGASLPHAQWLAARRWGHCSACKNEKGQRE